MGCRRPSCWVLLEGAILALIGGLGCLLALPMNGYATGTINFETFGETVFEFRITPALALKGMIFSLVVECWEVAACCARRACRSSPEGRMNPDQLKQLQISSHDKTRSRGATADLPGLAAVAVALFAWPRPRTAAAFSPKSRPNSAAPASDSNWEPKASPFKVEGSVLTTTGYIANRERIELVSRFMGVVK